MVSKRSLKKAVSKTYKESFLGVSRKSQVCFKKIKKKKLQVFFKECSMKFCFAILILHGSHRSYPSRRRACLVSYKAPV